MTVNNTRPADSLEQAVEENTSCIRDNIAESDSAPQTGRQASLPEERTRFYLAMAVMATVTTLSLAAVIQPTASEVLDKVLPLLTLVLGYFFGQQRHQRR